MTRRALIACGISALALMAQPARADTINVPASDLVRAAIAQQQYDLARRILEEMLRNQPGNVEASFMLAQVDGDDGHLAEAAERYRKILAAQPDLVRVRLELARTLFLLKDDDDAAEYNFRLVLALPDLPPEVRHNVQVFLDAIRLRRDWSLSLNASLAPNTNINAGPSTGTVFINGLPFELSNTTKQKSGIGATFTAAGEYDVHVSQDVKVRNGATAYRAEYPNKSFDDTQVEAYLGPQWVGKAVDVSVLGVLDRRWFGNDPYNVGFGPRVQLNWNVSSRFRVETQAEYLRRDYQDSRTFLNGYLADASATGLYSLTPTSYAKATVGFGYEHTTFTGFANKFYRAGLGYHRELPWGISFEDSPEAYSLRYEAADPFFGVVRDDWLVRNTLTVYKRDWHVWGFSPTFTYVFAKDLSNIPLDSFTQHQFLLGVTRQF